ncbi:2-oxoisovalerate dehydrogenase subunit alpha 1, mitochondrial-like [Cynara cardunculus var. scolymus]|uniref:2-oxoisovalerate dehydrogenase subunit alpha 1, mitochondrial-like n=1 Tax=Cynara cardunculus var. scolymus TaxID=59895 RepID=UPI000D62C03C|nr:2-oxoisovalerate dehydrogenase subunit alpha 1, mitochondrial-like [Cynara cardunculus var. scolymus]
MNISMWLTTTRRGGGGNFVKKIICNNPSLCSYYQTHSPSTYLLHSHLNNSIIRSNDCGFDRKPTRRFFYSSSYNSSYVAFVGALRYKSTTSGEQLLVEDDREKNTFDEIQGEGFPGGKIGFTCELNFLPGSSEKRVQCYRVLDEDGYPISSTTMEHVSKEVALKVYNGMITLQTMDKFFYEAQRQGRLSFYMTSFGEEAINLASAAALTSHDLILSQYREPGILLWRGFTLQEFANQCFGNDAGHGKGRQMPVHYGSKDLNFLTISSPLATQLPQAVGVAYSLKMEKKDACVVAYFGDGTTSEGDFHAALNFAAVMDAPVVFICRNNGWAISTPVVDQFRSDGIVVKGPAYGIQSIRVDGNDALAIYSAVSKAREIAVNEQRPILIEAMTYRVGHHSTSDDSTKYRPTDEIEYWKTKHSPITRLRKWIERKGWWSEKEESELHYDLDNQVKNAIGEAEKAVKPQLKYLFTDVYEDLPTNLIEQERLLRETVQRHPQDFPTDVPL